jgi:hypothetical protein
MDWIKEENGNWLAAVAGMCESLPLQCLLFAAADAPFSLTECSRRRLPSRRYSGLHVLSLSSPAVGSSSSALLQLLDSSHVIHGDGALVRVLERLRRRFGCSVIRLFCCGCDARTWRPGTQQPIAGVRLRMASL